MESEARGQVGGMEMGVAERERLARESRGWICRDCGVKNEDLLSKEDGEENKQGGEQVPEGLNLGYRDELGGKKTSPPLPQSYEQSSKSTPTIPINTTQTQTQPASAQAQPQPLGPILAQPPPSRTVQRTTPGPPAAQPGAVPTRSTPAIAQASEEPTPPWLDKAIVGVAAMLGFMLFKKAFGIELS